MAVCVGCGLFDPDDGINPVRVATSGEWGEGGLDYAGGDTEGTEIYCDETGELRGAPPHLCSAVSGTGSGAGSVGDGGTALAAPVTLIVNNPSAVRTCVIWVDWSMSNGFSYINALASWTYKFRAEVDGAEAFLLDNAQAPGNSAAGLMTVVQGASSHSTIGPAGNMVLEITCGVTADAGTSGSMNVAMAIRALCITT